MCLADYIWAHLSLGRPESQSQTHLLAAKCPAAVRARCCLVHFWGREDVWNWGRAVYLSNARWGSHLPEGPLRCLGDSGAAWALAPEREKFNAPDEDERAGRLPEHHGALAPQRLLAAHHAAAQRGAALPPARCLQPSEASSDRDFPCLPIRALTDVAEHGESLCDTPVMCWPLRIRREATGWRRGEPWREEAGTPGESGGPWETAMQDLSFSLKKKKNLSVIETCSVDIDFCSLFYSWTERSPCHRMIFYCRYRVPCTSLNLSFCGFLWFFLLSVSIVWQSVLIIKWLFIICYPLIPYSSAVNIMVLINY